MSANMRQTAPETTCGTLWVTCDNSPTADGTGPQKAPEGTEDMKSIDNLREYALTAASVNATTRAILVGYIDNIEREVAEVRDREYRNGMEDGEMAAERDGWVRLPVDADGVPIHVGDVVAATLAHGGSGRWVVDRMEMTRAYDQDLWQIALDKDGACWVTPSTVHHHRAPTVEDVLREFYVYAERGKEHHREDVDDAVLAEYAAKLALRGDE